MKLALTLAAAGACLIGTTSLVAATAYAQAQAKPTPGTSSSVLAPPPRDPSVSLEPTPAVDPVALAALNRMGDYLRTLTTFEVHAKTSIDEAFEDEIITFDGTVHYKVRRPDAFFLEFATDRKAREIYYDGKQLTIYSPRMKLYTTVAAPPTIAAVLKEAEEKYDVTLPLTDLFTWGTPEARTEELLEGKYIGPAKCGEATCDQFAFREAGVDWQIWIQAGDQPLPRKVVITTMYEDVRPQFSARLDWQLNAQVQDAAFHFTPPPESHAIRMTAAAE